MGAWVYKSPQNTTKPAETVTQAAKPEQTTAKALDISIKDAITKGNIEAVKQRLAAGTDVNAKDKDGRTPLHFATGKGHKEIAELLIASGADVNAKDLPGKGRTPLHSAAEGGHREIAELLIAKGARLISFEAHELSSIWGDEPKRSISPAQE